MKIKRKILLAYKKIRNVKKRPLVLRVVSDNVVSDKRWNILGR